MNGGITFYTLQRDSTSEEGTFGRLIDPLGNVLCHTAELPWNDNHPDTSCIPAGAYPVIPHSSAEHPNTWEISNVPNRSEILIHNGNLPLVDSKGCIIVGMKLGFLETHMAVLESMVAMNQLRNVLPDYWNINTIAPVPPVL